jgi:two-component system, LytTR family, sensor kinase
MTQRVRTATGALVAWALVTSLMATQTYYLVRAEGQITTWRGILGPAITLWSVWGLLVAPIAAMARRFAGIRSVVARVAAHALVGLTLAFIVPVVNYALQVTLWTVPGDRPQTISVYVREWLLFNLVVYAAVIAAVQAVEYWRRGRAHELAAARLGMELSQAQLRALQMQLRPHFLFNTLNTVAMLVRTNDGAGAVRMLAGLSDLLRQMLDDGAAHEVPLHEELAFLDSYLSIERTRFHDRLHIAMAVPPATLDAYLPRLVLQPLVENAIRHGVARRTAGGTLTISGARVGDALSVVVRDDGPGPSTDGRGTGDGVGLRNTRERLQRLYGARATLTLDGAPDGGATATLTIPWHTRPLLDFDGAAP